MPKISPLDQKLWPTGRGQTDGQTDRQTNRLTKEHPLTASLSKQLKRYNKWSDVSLICIKRFTDFCFFSDQNSISIPLKLVIRLKMIVLKAKMNNRSISNVLKVVIAVLYSSYCLTDKIDACL